VVEQEHYAKQGGHWEVLAEKVCWEQLTLTLTLTQSHMDLERPEQAVMAAQEQSCLD